MHESLERDEPVLGPSNRSFGLLFSAVFALAAVASWWRRGDVSPWPLTLALLFLVAALAASAALAPLNRVWLRIGLALHRIVNPVVMGALFYGAVTPFGVVMRAFGKRLTPGLRPDRTLPSYWVPRSGERSRMDQQF